MEKVWEQRFEKRSKAGSSSRYGVVMTETVSKAIGSTIPRFTVRFTGFSWVGFQPSVHMRGLLRCFTK